MTFEISSPVVFLDTETGGLSRYSQVWEVAMMRREVDGVESEYVFQIPIDVDRADPFALDVGRFWTRAQQAQQILLKPKVKDAVVLDSAQAAREIFRVTFGAHIVGAVPSFDAGVLTTLLAEHGLVPKWHYHLIDIEATALGYLLARGEKVSIPFKGQDLAVLLGVGPTPEEDLHTAMGDVRQVIRMFDKMAGL